MIPHICCTIYTCLFVTWHLYVSFPQTNSTVSRRYLHFLHYSGLSVSIGQIRWYTTYFNRVLLRVGQWKPGWLQTWFTWGVYFGILAMFGAVGVLGMTLVNAVKQKPAEKQVLTPVVRIVKNKQAATFFQICRA